MVKTKEAFRLWRDRQRQAALLEVADRRLNSAVTKLDDDQLEIYMSLISDAFVEPPER